ncbi:MAG: hypothetical protein ACI9MR_000917 [Myxococcota bacterium]
MTPRRSPRIAGAVIGAVSGPAAGFGASWSGMADGHWGVWILATAVGAILGALAWPVFVQPLDGDAGSQAFPVGFAALFGAVAGMLAGTVAAFPMGAVFGSIGGAVGGASAGLVFYWVAQSRFAQSRWQPAVASLVGMAAGLLILVGWTR